MNELPTVLGIEPFVPIVVICYFLGAFLKALGKEMLDKFIPEIVAVFGGGLATLVFFTIPGYLPSFAQNWFAAFVLGVVSGAVAVWINQVYKQSKKHVETYFEEETPDDVPVTDEELKDEGI